jgi:hypothetical protein
MAKINESSLRSLIRKVISETIDDQRNLYKNRGSEMMKHRLPMSKVISKYDETTLEQRIIDLGWVGDDESLLDSIHNLQRKGSFTKDDILNVVEAAEDIDTAPGASNQLSLEIFNDLNP